MAIKYHQNGIGNEYGADGKLTNNWNPSADYRNEYAKVYFRLNTPLYHFHNGFITETDREAFYTEAGNILNFFDILEDCGYKVEHSGDKRAYLYIHPQNISGVIKKNDVKKLAEALEKMKTASVRWVDLYETVYVMSDEEYEKHLDEKKTEIRQLLFKKSATTRKNKFYSAFDVARDIAGDIKIHRLGFNDGQTIDYILKCTNEMITEGYLKDFDNGQGKYIRSLNKTEQKALKPFVA